MQADQTASDNMGVTRKIPRKFTNSGITNVLCNREPIGLTHLASQGHGPEKRKNGQT
jgi:hypothetical protein